MLTKTKEKIHSNISQPIEAILGALRAAILREPAQGEFISSSAFRRGQVSASMLQDRVGQLSPVAIQVRIRLLEPAGRNEVLLPGCPSIRRPSPVRGSCRKGNRYNAPSGETLHHDVFRDMLTNKDGRPI